MIEQLTNNWLCWAILLLALVCYQQLWLDVLHRRQHKEPAVTADGESSSHSDEGHAPLANHLIKREFSGVLIAALPLLGLLGTIIGLLDCFAGIASQGASSELVSGGIADALLTTQLGLVCAIPGWLLQSWVQSWVQTPSRPNLQQPATELAR